MFEHLTMPNKKCIICLNYVKSKRKVVPRHSVQEQMLITYLLRKIAWTPLSDTDFEGYLQHGSPSEWGAMCHICEEQVKHAFDLHQKINKMAGQIAVIRRKLYEENFYESDSEEDSGESREVRGVQIFPKLRRHLREDFRETRDRAAVFNGSVTLTYTNDPTIKRPSSPFQEPQIKQEPYFEENDDYVESMEEAVDAFFNPGVINANEFLNPGMDASMGSESEGGQEGKLLERPLKKKQRTLNISKDDSDCNAYPDSSKSEARESNINSGICDTAQNLLRKLDKDEIDCPICKKQYSSPGAMRRHYRETHLKYKRYPCTECSMRFARKEYLTIHFSQVHLGKEFGKIVKTESKSEIRQSSVPEETPDERTHCSVCDKSFINASTMKRHYRESHLKKREHKCMECSKGFARAEYLDCHVRRFHPRDSQGSHVKKELKTTPLDTQLVPLDELPRDRRDCPVCNNEFSLPVVMRRHYQELHLKLKQFKCTECSEDFVRKEHLITHIQVNHYNSQDNQINQDESNFKCPACPRKFQTRQALRIHRMRTHRKEFPCETCEKSYDKKESLQEHVLLHHSSLGAEPKEEPGTIKSRTCSLCDKSFTSHGSMRRHLRETHLRSKNYNCDYCDKSFYRKEFVMKHISQYHSGESKRNVSCKNESEHDELVISEELKEVHQNEESIQCDRCGESFSDSNSLSVHIEVAHNEGETNPVENEGGFVSEEQTNTS